MNRTNPNTNSTLSRMAAAWNAFWFSPQDPTLLGLMRIFVGMVTLYTFTVQGFMLYDFLGEDGWYDLRLRREMFHERPVVVPGELLFSPSHVAASLPDAPANDNQITWAEAYKKNWGLYPPSPHPENQSEADFSFNFRTKHGFDFRMFGLPFPKTAWERKVFDDYMAKYNQPFPPPYPQNEDEVAKIDRFISHHALDPRRVYSRGLPIFSFWMDVTDPAWMVVLQIGCVLTALCFTLGVGTRVSSALVWFANLCYIHRNPAMLFGVDTMMNILLLYLMIGPSGAALSIDRLISRWWSGAKQRLFPGTAPASYSPVPLPSVSANVAVRLLQIHLCIIYFIAGVSKLQGSSWWQGTAVWGVLANPEFAPMDFDLYNRMIRILGHNQLLFDSAITGAGLLTLAFEISYAYLIWRPSTRWLFLAGAIFLHGFIGLFMGLKTFSLLMLVFNMAFLKNEEVAWVLSWLSPNPTPPPQPARANRERPELVAQ